MDRFGPPVPPWPAVPSSVAHRPSHRLLVPSLGAGPAVAGLLDAVVVPTSRPLPFLAYAAGLAGDLGAPLLLLCSGESDARAAVDHPAVAGRGTVVAVEVPVGTTGPLAGLRVSDHPASRYDGHGNAAVKRNLALAIARSCGWRRILFLDDDVRGIRGRHALHAAGAVGGAHGHVRAAGWAVDDYPDNSVVCHANRLTGAPQTTFVCVGALTVGIGGAGDGLPFFPPVYNEDWLFMFDWVAARAVVLAGTAGQLPFNPFHDPARAAGEEFGDVLAEGLYELLHRRRPEPLAEARTPAYWQAVITARRALIDEIAGRSGGRMPEAMARSLAAARTRLDTIEPRALVDYVCAWRADLRSWNAWLEDLPRHRTAAAAAAHLGHVAVTGGVRR